MRIAIIHPWFPQYRRELFELLHSKGRKQGLEIDIFYGTTPPETQARGDAISAEYAEELPTRYFKFGSKSLGYKSLHRLRSTGPYDLVIVEQAVRNLETYALLFGRLAPRVAFWGHGRTYTKSVSAIQERIKMKLTMQGSWFFAYTEGGASAMSAQGFPKDAITVVNNSIDTRALKSSIASVSDDEVRGFRDGLGLTGPTALFLGGLDQSKRLDFLLEASSIISRKIPDFKLVVAGKGVDEPLISEAARRQNHIVYAGPLHGKQKAIAMRSSDVMAMPGRVGLVAVDSFAAGLPIATTDWPWHAPEFEYLTHGVNAIVSPDTLEDYASSVVKLFSNKQELHQLADGCRHSATTYTIESMTDRFLDGLHNLSMSFDNPR